MPAPSDPSLYELLEVSHAASAQEIEGAYQRVSGLVAPDSLAVYAMLDETEVRSLRDQVDEAYKTLRDPVLRAAYDNQQNDVQRGQGAQAQRLRPLPVSDLPLPEPRAPFKPSPLPLVQPQGPSARVATRLGQGPSISPQAAPQGRSGPDRMRAQGGRKLLRPTIALEYNDALEVTGALLRSIRESAQASLDDVSDITKISKRYLAAVEADDYVNLPATVYVRGFVSEYARALGLEPREVAKSYMTQYQRHRVQSGG